MFGYVFGIGMMAVGIDSDCYDRYFYWTDVVGGSISKAKLDGTDPEVIISGNRSSSTLLLL